MRAWSEKTNGWQILWASQHGVWHEGSINEIPSTNTLLIVDDAHLYDDLGKIVSAVSAWTGTGQLKLLIGTRPSGVAPIDGILARLTNSATVVRFKKLPKISIRATVELAKEVLGLNHQSQAERLAEVSKDIPLITVVGGKLIALGEITPDLLLNHEDFRSEVFNKFLEERSGADSQWVFVDDLLKNPDTVLPNLFEVVVASFERAPVLPFGLFRNCSRCRFCRLVDAFSGEAKPVSTVFSSLISCHSVTSVLSVSAPVRRATEGSGEGKTRSNFRGLAPRESAVQDMRLEVWSRSIEGSHN